MFAIEIRVCGVFHPGEGLPAGDVGGDTGGGVGPDAFFPVVEGHVFEAFVDVEALVPAVFAAGDGAHHFVAVFAFGVFDEDVLEDGDFFGYPGEEGEFVEGAGPDGGEAVVFGVGSSGADGEEESGFVLIAFERSVLIVCCIGGVVFPDTSIFEAGSCSVPVVCFEHFEEERCC